MKVPRGVVTDEPDSDSQGSHREVWARRRDSEIVARRTETRYKALQTDEMAKDIKVPKVTVTLRRRLGG